MSAHQKDEEFRRFSLSAHPLRLLLTVCGPLAVYQAFQQIFTILDTIMAAHVSADAVSAIAVLAQITLMIQAVGTGLAVGGCIKISEAYGMGNYELVQQRTSTLYALAVILSAVLAVTIIPFAKPFLRLLQTPEDLIAVGVTMMVSNIATGICSALVVIPVIRQIRRLSEQYEGETAS